MTDYYAYDAGLPCRNPHCKSHGKPHPNCHCYGGMGSQDHFAKGGAVCDGPHKSDCKYFKSGGPVMETQAPTQPVNPQVTIGHAAVQHGLLGLMKNVGKSKLAEPEKHAEILNEARAHMDPRMEGEKVTAGHKLGAHLSGRNHEAAAEAMHTHPIVSGIGKTSLKPIMERLGPSILANEPNPQALKGSADYLNSALKGNNILGIHMDRLFDKPMAKDRIKPDEMSRKHLKDHLQAIQENPEEAMSIGGDIGHYLPEHAAALGSLTATATNYFSSLKPTQMQNRPLDMATPPDKVAMQQYDRQIDIAQKPQLALQHIQDGTLMPQDVITIQTIYPALYKSMTAKASEALVNAKVGGKEISYKQKQALSILLNEPLDSTMTPFSMQAIMNSQGEQQMQNQQRKSKSSGDKATAVEMKAIDKFDKMSETPIESRQIDKVSK